MMRLLPGSSVLVLGGGVVGLSVARELAGRGLAVTLVEARCLGQGASGAAVGVLSAPTAGRSAWARLCRSGYELHATLARELREETGIDCGYRECGALHLLEDVPRRPEKTLSAWAAAEVPARWLDGVAIDEWIPGYGRQHRVALRLEREAVISPPDLVSALAASCRRRGVRIHERTGATRLVGADEVRVRARAVDGLEWMASAAVIAAGTWSQGTLDAGVRTRAPDARVRPIRGQALELRLPAPRSIIHFSRDDRRYYLVPRGNDLLWVGSTVEDVGFEERVTSAGQQELLAAAREVIPGVDEAHIVRQWCGLRPQAQRRGGPYLGPWPGQPHVWAAFGHYRSGVLAGPESARLLAEHMTEGRPLEPAFAL